MSTEDLPKIYVRISLLLPKTMNIAEVTRHIGIEPTESWDDLANAPRWAKAMYPEWKGWIHEREPVHTIAGESVLEEFVEQLMPRADAIQELVTERGALAEIGFTIYLRDDSPSFHLSRQTLKQLAKLEVDLDIDIIRLSSRNK